MLISYLFTNPMLFLIMATSLMFALVIHEYFHGWVAYILGDDTAKLSGRLTVNPIAHYDPVLTTMALVFGFGAAKPVPVNPHKIKNGNRGLMYVSLAGILANLVSAIVFVFVLKVMIVNSLISMDSLLFIFLQQLIYINLLLMVFNLIPVPPLDGSKVLLTLIPDSYQNIYHYFSQNQGMSLFLAVMLFMTVGHKIVGFLYNLIFSLVFWIV